MANEDAIVTLVGILKTISMIGTNRKPPPAPTIPAPKPTIKARMAASHLLKVTCSKGIGVYGNRYNGIPLGDIFQRNVVIKTGQAPVIPYMPYLYKLISEGKVDPGDVVTHVLPIDQAKHGYQVFDTRTDRCIKVVLKP